MFAILLYHIFADKYDISSLIQPCKAMFFLSDYTTADG